MLRLISLGLLVFPLMSFGGPKDDFLKAVEAQCGIGPSDASGLATPGRTGTVVQFKLCIKPSVRVSDSCTVKCKKKGSNIGR